MFTVFFLRMLNREASSAKSMPDKILERLRLREGQSIADIGSGGGFFTLAFAQRVGKTGRVYAVDVDKRYLDFVRKQSEKEGLDTVRFVLAGPDGTDLPEAALDLIFARNVFHHLVRSSDYFADLKKFLKPGGTVAVIEHKKKGFGFVSLFGHHTPPETIIRDMERAGYSRTVSYDFLPAQTFTLFSVKR